MSTDPAGRQSPLDNFRKTVASSAGASAGVVISEEPYLGHLNLRGDSSDSAFTDAVGSAMGFELPVEPNSVSGGSDMQALWLGPDEWLVVTPPDERDPVAARLDEALARVHSSVTDISGGQTLINLSGEQRSRSAGQGLFPGPASAHVWRGKVRPDPRVRGQRHPRMGWPGDVIRPHSPAQLR